MKKRSTNSLSKSKILISAKNSSTISKKSSNPLYISQDKSKSKKTIYKLKSSSLPESKKIEEASQPNPKDDPNLSKVKILQSQQERIKILQEEIEKANNELNNKKKDFAKLGNIHQSKKKELNELINKLSETNDSLEKIKQENKDLHKKIDRLQNTLLRNRQQRGNNGDRNRERDRGLQFIETILLSQLMNQIREISERNADAVPNIDNMTYEELLELEERIGNVSKGLPEAKIKKLPIDVYIKGKYGNDRCVVCQYEYKLNEKVKLLPCKHIFHPECIDEWLKNEKQCPFCKAEIH